jgi:hypothetical protein
MATKNVYLEIIDWDEACRDDKITGRAVSISDQPYTKDVKNPHGSHSPEFCSD